MSILNVNQIQPVGGGNTITVSASDISASGATITATSFVGPLTGAVTGNVTGNLTGNVTSSSTSTFSSGINVTGGRVLVGTTDAGSNGTADDLVVANNSSASDQAGISIRGGTSGRSQIFFSDGTSGQDEYRGMLRYDHSENSMQFRTDAAERLRITSGGRILLGTTTVPTGLVLGNSLTAASSTGAEVVAFRSDTSVAVGDKCGAFVIGNSDTDGAEDHFVGMWGKVASTNGSMDLHFAAGRASYEGDTPDVTIKSGGNFGVGTNNPTKALHLAQNSDIAIRMDSNNSNANARTWEIVVGGNASNNAEMVFRTRQDDGTGGSECARIKRNGIIALPSGGGIDFSATSNSSGSMGSELLDDYEEGTFDPTIGPQTSGSITLNSSYNTLSYIKIGRLVYIGGQIRISSVSSPVGNTTITNLPFTVQSTTEQGRAGANCFYFDASAGTGNYYKAVPIHVNEGTTTLKILNLHALGGFNPAASDELTFAFSYVAAP